VPEDVQESLADEAIARLTIYSETTSAEDLAAAFTATPDEKWNKGEPTRRGKLHTTTAIEFCSRIPASAPPGDHLADLLARIEPLREELREQLAAGSSAHLKIALFADTDNPMFALSAELLRRVGAFDLDLHLDIYEL
jgi:hypothetical protein